MMKEMNIFVSYSHNDAKTVEHIIALIRKYTNNEVWYDARLVGGENYFSVIAEQILKCSFFVFVVSENSVNSDFCLRELEFAASEKKAIVAFWLDNITISPRVKLVIQNTHYVNCYSTSEKKFETDIGRVFSSASMHKDRVALSEITEERTWNGKYFLSEGDIRKIDSLLEREKQGQYTICFDPQNAVLLGLAYEMGISAEQDTKKAGFYYHISHYYGNVDGEYLSAGLKQLEESDSQKINEFRSGLAEKNCIYALVDLGNDYYEGKNGCEVDRNKAYELYKKAADQGSPEALYYMAYGFRSGECFEADYQIALMYALKSKELGFPRAFRILAFMYEDGQFFDKDYRKAIEFYEEAVKRGDYLSLCYEGFVQGEIGNIAKKKELYFRAAELADENVINSGLPYTRKAFLYEDGEGVDEDCTVASQYYLKGAERNHSVAKKWAVKCIRRITSDEERKEFLIKALELGCNDAGYELGTLEENKENDRLSENAIKYLTQGAEQGDMRCTVELLMNYSVVIGKGKDRNDRSEAIKWFQFLFANADQSLIEEYRNAGLLTTYYYAYAIELDYDPDVNMPDRKFVQMYFVKSLEESPVHFKRILSFVVDGYLFPEKSSSGLEMDVVHAEEMSLVLLDYLKPYFDYVQNKDEKTTEWRQVLELFQTGFDRLSKCYANGKIVKKSWGKIKKYTGLALDFKEMLKVLDSGEFDEDDICFYSQM